MGLEVNKKSENIHNKPKLSKFGKKTVAVVILIIIILIFMSSILIFNSSKKQNLENELNNQINSSLNVMEQSLIISDANEDILKEFYSYEEEILNEENITSKYTSVHNPSDIKPLHAE